MCNFVPEAKTHHMNRIYFSIVLFLAMSFMAKSQSSDLDPGQLPANVRMTLSRYVEALHSGSLQQCADKFVRIAGGPLLSDDGAQLAPNTESFSLKNDFDNIKSYAQPIQILKVNVRYSNGMGFGQTTLKGQVYKIWLGKPDGSSGPVSIIVPEGSPTFTEPRVVGIGSL